MDDRAGYAFCVMAETGGAPLQQKNYSSLRRVLTAVLIAGKVASQERLASSGMTTNNPTLYQLPTDDQFTNNESVSAVFLCTPGENRFCIKPMIAML